MADRNPSYQYAGWTGTTMLPPEGYETEAPETAVTPYEPQAVSSPYQNWWEAYQTPTQQPHTVQTAPVSTARTVSTSVPVPYSGTPPTMPELPTLAYPEMKMPEWNESRVRRLQQAAAAPGIRRLRQTVQAALGRYYENPNVRAQNLRQALAGYGTGLESVMAGAGRQARAEYEAEYGRQQQQAQNQWMQEINRRNMQYQAEIARQQAMYNQAWNQYMQGYGAGGTGDLAAQQQRLQSLQEFAQERA